VSWEERNETTNNHECSLTIENLHVHESDVPFREHSDRQETSAESFAQSTIKNH
jgi:hypothetical protein